ncbi:unnamed protein product [Lampetra planeri]
MERSAQQHGEERTAAWRGAREELHREKTRTGASRGSQRAGRRCRGWSRVEAAASSRGWGWRREAGAARGSLGDSSGKPFAEVATGAAGARGGGSGGGGGGVELTEVTGSGVTATGGGGGGGG